jgi:hypothetical protein
MNAIRCRRLISTIAVLLAAASVLTNASAEDSAAILRTRIPECAIHVQDGPWVPKEVYSDGVLRFTYLYEPPKKNPGEYDYRDGTHNIYAAFWNSSRTKGELLQFVGCSAQRQSNCESSTMATSLVSTGRRTSRMRSGACGRTST